jgi:hypothetical protein
VTWRDIPRQAINDNETGLASSTRIAILIASSTLGFSTCVLTFAVLWKPELVPALSVVAGGLAGMSGASYVSQRAWSGRRNWTDRGMNDE